MCYGRRERKPYSFPCARRHSLRSPRSGTARSGRCALRPGLRPVYGQQGLRFTSGLAKLKSLVREVRVSCCSLAAFADRCACSTERIEYQCASILEKRRLQFRHRGAYPAAKMRCEALSKPATSTPQGRLCQCFSMTYDASQQVSDLAEVSPADGNLLPGRDQRREHHKSTRALEDTS